jgi:hypothetical protein
MDVPASPHRLPQTGDTTQPRPTALFSISPTLLEASGAFLRQPASGLLSTTEAKLRTNKVFAPSIRRIGSTMNRSGSMILMVPDLEDTFGMHGRDKPGRGSAVMIASAVEKKLASG